MTISELVSSFCPLVDKNEIQSEEEVRSKFIVPLLEIMGYPMELRAEEFPVYGSEGSKPLKTKKADYILFSDCDFASHRSNTNDNLKWVYEHSLLVFEAKKPSEEISIFHQPQFYAVWTRAVAYMISNGKKLVGYFLNPNFSDVMIISCDVSELPIQFDKLSQLHYNNMREKKVEASALNNGMAKDPFCKYIEAMAIRCSEELYCNVERVIVENPIYTPRISLNDKEFDIAGLLQESAAVITSEPGGGKSTLMWRIMRECIWSFDGGKGVIPIMLEGRYYGQDYTSISDGVYKELHRYCNSMTRELADNLIANARVFLLLDGFDEIKDSQTYTKELLARQLSQIRFDAPDIKILISSREQNYHGEFHTGFKHYQIKRLTDKAIDELISLLSKNKVHINLWTIPSDLKELIRTPLFLKLFVSVLQKDSNQSIPRSKLALFEQYLNYRTERLKCTGYQTTKLIKALAEYAHYVLESGESNDEFVKILDSITSTEGEKYYSLIWNTGFIIEGRNGAKFFHKTIAEFFYSIWLSKLEIQDMMAWMQNHINDQNYYEGICYLTGVVSQRPIQDKLLDYIECNNLPLLIQTLRTRKTFEPDMSSITEDFGTEYFTRVLCSYQAIVSHHFPKVSYIFDGYRKNAKCCITANIDTSAKAISLLVFEGEDLDPAIQVKWENSSGIVIKSAAGNEIPFGSAILTYGHFHHRHFNLQMMGYGYDSAREIALRMIKEQLNEAIDKKRFLDRFFPALICETIEIELKSTRSRILTIPKEERKNLSLYSMTLPELSAVLSQAAVLSKNSEFSQLSTICETLAKNQIDPKEWLDIPPNITPKENCFYAFDDLYTNDQIVKKMERIFTLRDSIMNDIMDFYLPFLSHSHYQRARIIGFIYREKNDKKNGYFSNSSFDFISIQCARQDKTTPIIRVTEKPVTTLSDELPEDVYELVCSIGKTKNDILGSGASVLSHYFDKEIIHKTVFDELKQLVESIFRA